MPAIAVAVVAYTIGLWVGFSAGIPGPLVAFLGAAAWSAWRRDSRPAALALIAVSGAAVASAAGRSDRACLRRGAERAQWTVVLERDARPGGMARGVTTRPHECAVVVTALVARGRGAAGDVVRVEGAAAPAGRGLLVRDAAIVPTGASRMLPRWRARAGVAIDRAFGADAALARALLIADARAIPAAVRERFAAAGLVHVLSISGLHVAILAAALELLFGVARLSRRTANLAACVAAALYVALLGFPAPAVRAALMLGVSTAAGLAQRPTSPWASLALAAAGPLLLDPHAALDLGFQLSVAGMAALIGGGAVGRRHLAPRLRGWRLATARELATSTIATAVTTPLVAWWFGQVPLVAPFTNLLAAPLVALLQPTLFLALAAAPVPRVAEFVAGAAHPMLAALDAVAAGAARVPYASVYVAPTLTSAVVCGVAVALGLWACVAANPARPMIGAAAGIALLAWMPARVGWSDGMVELHMLDVGQGDALALRTGRGRWLLFDAGPGWPTGDAARAVIVPYVRRRGGEVAAFVLSHPHLDHVGGAATVLQALRPADYWDAGYPGGGERYRASLTTAAADGVRWRRPRPGDSLAVDGVVVRFLAPDSAWAAALTDANDASTVALVEVGAVRFLLVGDAERAEEEWLLAHAGAALRADVLKVGHHGSRTSSTPDFLEAVRPRVALVSVGLGNEYGHPSPEVVRRLSDGGAAVLRTDLLGTVVVRTDGRRLTIVADDTEWPVPSPASPAEWPPP